MRTPTILIGLGSGQEGWLSIELDSLKFARSRERQAYRGDSLACRPENPAELADLVAEILADAVVPHGLKWERPSGGDSDGLR